MWTENYQKYRQDFEEAEFRRGRGTRDQIANICWNSYFCFIDYAKAFDCVDHNKLWQVLKEMGVPDHLICLLRNLYVGQEATMRTGHRTTDWFKIEKGVRQGCIPSPWLFNLYAEHIMRKAGLDESPVGIKTAGRNINNLRYADDTILMAESEEQLKSLLMRVKEESAKVGLKLNIKKTKIMASGPVTSLEIDGKEMEVVTDFIFLGPKITAGGDCSQEIKRRLLLGRKAMANLDSILKSRDITLPTKVRIVKVMVFPVAMYGYEKSMFNNIFSGYRKIRRLTLAFKPQFSVESKCALQKSIFLLRSSQLLNNYHKYYIEFYPKVMDFITYFILKPVLGFGPPRKFTCPLCDRSFTEKWAMNNHMKLHTGEKPYKCTWPTCHYSFLTASAMKDHYRTHTGEKSFLCDLCGFAGGTRHALTKHRRQHTGEKPFKCDECNFASTTQSHLTRHKRVHTGEKPYRCPWCDYREVSLAPALLSFRPGVSNSRPAGQLLGRAEHGGGALRPSKRQPRDEQPTTTAVVEYLMRPSLTQTLLPAAPSIGLLRLHKIMTPVLYDDLMLSEVLTPQLKMLL
ncbi:hypothetical protein EYD10_08652 [Varanus komodoensis]|nr:hypothetical protein EYD10_08652 [Varanus komodoensis]